MSTAPFASQDDAIRDLTRNMRSKLTISRPAAVGGLRVRGPEASSTTPAKLPGVAGTDYQYPDINWYRGAYAMGIRQFRISSVPSRTRGALLDAYMQHVASVLGVAQDVTVVLDPMHCYGVDSTDSATKLVLGVGWTPAAFGAQWGQIMSHATAKTNAARIVAVDLLNEPNTDDMTGQTSAQIAVTLPKAWQAATDAIRATGYAGTILCQPHFYAKSLELNNSLPNGLGVTDPLGRLAACIHYYFDDAGVYGKSYVQHLVDCQNSGWATFADKTDYMISVVRVWQTAHPGIPVWVGEVGWGVGPQWDADARDLLSKLNKAGLPWLYDSLAPNSATQNLTPPSGMMEPFAPALGQTALTVERDQGRAITHYSGGSTDSPQMPSGQGSWAGLAVNAVRNPRAVSGGGPLFGLNGWGNATLTYLTGQTGWANGTTTAARATIPTANSGSGNGIQTADPIPDGFVALGATLPVSAQVRRSGVGNVQIEAVWLNRASNVVGSSTNSTAVAAGAGAIVSLTGVTPARPAGGMKVQVTVKAASPAAGETIDVTNLSIGAPGNGAMSGWAWTSTANNGASYQIPATAAGGGSSLTTADLDALMGA